MNSDKPTTLSGYIIEAVITIALVAIFLRPPDAFVGIVSDIGGIPVTTEDSLVDFIGPMRSEHRQSIMPPIHGLRTVYPDEELPWRDEIKGVRR